MLDVHGSAQGVLRVCRKPLRGCTFRTVKYDIYLRIDPLIHLSRIATPSFKGDNVERFFYMMLGLS